MVFVSINVHADQCENKDLESNIICVSKERGHRIDPTYDGCKWVCPKTGRVWGHMSTNMYAIKDGANDQVQPSKLDAK